jgi:hypothetical protein
MSGSRKEPNESLYDRETQLMEYELTKNESGRKNRITPGEIKQILYLIFSDTNEASKKDAIERMFNRRKNAEYPVFCQNYFNFLDSASTYNSVKSASEDTRMADKLLAQALQQSRDLITTSILSSDNKQVNISSLAREAITTASLVTPDDAEKLMRIEAALEVAAKEVFDMITTDHGNTFGRKPESNYQVPLRIAIQLINEGYEPDANMPKQMSPASPKSQSPASPISSASPKSPASPKSHASTRPVRPLSPKSQSGFFRSDSSSPSVSSGAVSSPRARSGAVITEQPLQEGTRARSHDVEDKSRNAPPKDRSPSPPLTRPRSLDVEGKEASEEPHVPHSPRGPKS